MRSANSKSARSLASTSWTSKISSRKNKRKLKKKIARVGIWLILWIQTKKNVPRYVEEELYLTLSKTLESLKLLWIHRLEN